MHRLFVIAVLGAAAVLPPNLGAQFRGGMRFGGSGFRGPIVSSGPRTIVPSGSRPVFTTVPSGAFFQPRVFGRFGNFAFDGRFVTAFGHNPRFRVFSGNSCFGCRRFFFRRGFAYPYIYPGYYPSGPAYDTSYSQPSYPSTPMVVVVQSPPANGENEQLVQEVEGLRAEVQQMREEQQGRQTLSPSGQAKPGVRPSTQGASERVEEAPSTILVFRNGQRSEIQNYAITGKTLWVFNERQARKILLSDLDVSATQAANAAQGVEFLLPR